MTQPCTYCGRPVYGGPDAHPCCRRWREDYGVAVPCPSCAESRRAQRARTHRGDV